MNDKSATNASNGVMTRKIHNLKYVVKIMYDGASDYIDRQVFEDIKEADVYKTELEEFWKFLGREVSVLLVSRIEIIEQIDTVVVGV